VQKLRVEIEQVVEVVDMTHSYPTINALDCDIDTDSDLDEDVKVQQSVGQLGSKGISKEGKTQSDILPDHRLPTPSETGSPNTVLPTSSEPPVSPSTIVVATHENPETQSEASPVDLGNDNRKPGYKNSEVSSDLSSQTGHETVGDKPTLLHSNSQRSSLPTFQQLLQA
jgi:hypothetical protein